MKVGAALQGPGIPRRSPAPRDLSAFALRDSRPARGLRLRPSVPVAHYAPLARPFRGTRTRAACQDAGGLFHGLFLPLLLSRNRHRSASRPHRKPGRSNRSQRTAVLRDAGARAWRCGNRQDSGAQQPGRHGTSQATYIITGCGSCGSAWQHRVSRNADGRPAYRAKATYWGARTYDISTFLTDIIKFRDPTGRVEAVVTYHDPCHLKKSMSVSREPREILRSIPGSALPRDVQARCLLWQRRLLRADAHRDCRGDRQAQGRGCRGHRRDHRHHGLPGVHDAAPGYARTGSGGTQRVRHYISLLADAYRAETKTEEEHAGTL